MRLFRRQEPVVPSILLEIEETKKALHSAYANLEEVIDPDLIDSYIYQVNSVQKRYQYLLRLAETELGIE